MYFYYFLTVSQAYSCTWDTLSIMQSLKNHKDLVFELISESHPIIFNHEMVSSFFFGYRHAYPGGADQV